MSLLYNNVGKKMFERDASLALSDARFLTEGELVTAMGSSNRPHSYPLLPAEADPGTVEVDESLFQDLQDLEVTETTPS